VLSREPLHPDNMGLSSLVTFMSRSGLR
jgi:hypothetical protein